jgi:hypothetical protein
VVNPIAIEETKGAFHRRWRLASLDGSTLDVADNEAALGRPATRRGKSACPQLRFVSLLERGTPVLFGPRIGSRATGEITLARQVLPRSQARMLCLADREFLGLAPWKQARAAELPWRVKKNPRLPCSERLADGSSLSRIDRSRKHRRDAAGTLTVRGIEYRLEGVPGAEPLYRLITTLPDPEQAPAEELAALCAQRREIETALDELKTRPRGARIVLGGKTPELVRQEFHGPLLAHFAIRGLRHEAALKGQVDPDQVSYVHAARVIRRGPPHFVAISPSAQEHPS